MLSLSESDELLSRFPAVEFAFAYGSGAIKQDGYDHFNESSGDGKAAKKTTSAPMLDLIFAVDQSANWHQENMARNPSHYTSIVPLSSNRVAWVQDEIPANFWFNAYVPFPSEQYPGRMIKYGVISKANLLRDLIGWNQLYAAGRLHKPVHVLKNDPDINSAMVANREQAVKTSLLLLPDRFCERDLYLSIASLSYVGDPRMIFGENPKKIVNLVTPIIPVYRDIYKDTVKKMLDERTVDVASTTNSEVCEHTSESGNCSSFIGGSGSSGGGSSENGRNNSMSGGRGGSRHSSGSSNVRDNGPVHWTYLQMMCTRQRWELCNSLPETLRTIVTRVEGIEITHSPSPQLVRTALASIVARSSSIQTCKGLFTAGVIKGGSYLLAKIAKRFAVS